MGKRLLICSLLAVFIYFSGSIEKEAAFKDVPSGVWYEKDLEEAVNKGLIKGTEDNAFNPDENITYAQFIAVLVREKFGEQAINPNGLWYEGYVRKAVECGIVDPKKEVPGWDREIPRGRMAIFLCRSLNIKPDETTELIFADSYNPDMLDYYKYLTKAYKEYLVEGTGFGTGINFFKVISSHGLPVTRAQLSTIILRINNYRVDADIYKAERSKLREGRFAERREEYAQNIGLKYQSSSGHFDFYLNDTDIKAIPDLTKKLEDNYKRIVEDLKPVFTEKVRVLIYPDINTFHNAVKMPNAANWVVGTGGDNQLSMVSPLNPGEVHTYNSLIQIVVHEFTHVVTKNINNKSVNKWLWEGIACYEAKQYNINEIKSLDMAKIPTLKQMQTNNSETFGNMNGYLYSYLIVDYIIEKYGVEKVAELIRTPGDYIGVLGITEEELESQWIKYLNDIF